MKNLTTIIIALLFTTAAFAQIEELDMPIDMEESTAKGAAVFGAFGEIVSISKPVMTKKSKTKFIGKRATVFNKVAYTGYSIQLTTSMDKLSDTNSLFAEFGDLMLEENTNPRYCYMMGKFRTKEGAEKFLEYVLAKRYPNAKIIRYKKGKRKRRL
jgi:hypothetical protein